MAQPSASSPFSIPSFRILWVLALTANGSNLVQTVAAAWTMTGIGSPALVASVQTALTMPVMLFAFAAGTLADHAGRRHVLIAAFAMMFLSAGVLAVASAMGLAAPALILAACFLFGCGTALFNPTLVTTVGDHVSSAALPEAVAGVGIAYNLARCVGPAVGGVLISVTTPTVSYVLNALVALAMIVVVANAVGVQPTRHTMSFAAALGHASRLVGRSRPLRIILTRSFLYTVASSPIWALTPLVARQQLGGGPATYGLQMSALGVGAILFALRMRYLRERLGLERIVVVFTLLGALGLAALPHMPTLATALGAMLLLGASYTGVMTVWSAAAQLSVPRELAGRAVGAFHTALFGGLAFGSWAWGHLAQAYGLATAITLSGVVVGLGALVGIGWPVPAIPLPLGSTDDQSEIV